MSSVKSDQRSAQSSPSQLSRQGKHKKPVILADELNALAWYFALALLTIAALVLFLNPLKLYTQQGGLLPQPRALFGFVAFSGGTYLLGVLLLAVAGVVGWWRLWARRVANPAFQNKACPQCEAEALKRTPRRVAERLLSRWGIPVRRYICAECKWQGRRIDPTKG